MNLNDKEDEIRVFGSLNYTIEEIANFFNLNNEQKYQLTKRLQNQDDNLYKAYHKGLFKATYDIDVSLINNAKNGDIDAIEARSARSKERKNNQLKKELFGI